MITIDSKKELVALKNWLGVRDDWHEPDEQDVSCHVEGCEFDNAGFDTEMHVVLHQDGETYRVNLATLLSWASA